MWYFRYIKNLGQVYLSARFNRCRTMKNPIFFCISLLLSTLPLFTFAQLASNPLENYLTEHQIEAQQTSDGLYFALEKDGIGQFPQSGDYVKVHYVGRLLDGSVFDQSDPNTPIVFQLGRRQVIAGWELGIPLFRKGAKGQLFLPPNLAYGKRGAGKAIPPNAPLIFEIELVDIMDIEAYDRYMEEQDARERRRFEQEMAVQFQKDQQSLREYIRENKLKAKSTDSGLHLSLIHI